MSNFRSLFLGKCCIPEKQVPYFLIWVSKYKNFCNGVPGWCGCFSRYEIINGLLNHLLLHVAVIICGLSCSAQHLAIVYQRRFKIIDGSSNRTGLVIRALFETS